MALVATWTATWVDLDGVTQSVSGPGDGPTAINTPYAGSSIRPALDAEGRAFCDVEIDFGQPVSGTIDENSFFINSGFVSFDILPQSDNQRWIFRTEISVGTHDSFKYWLLADQVSAGGESNVVDASSFYFNTIDLDVENPAFDITFTGSGLSNLLIPPGIENNTADNPLRGGGDLFSIDLGTPASGLEVADILVSNGASIEVLSASGGVEGAREIHLRVEFPTSPGSGTFSIMFPAGSMTLFDDTSVENDAFEMLFYYSLAIITPPPPDPPTPPDPNADAVATLSIVESTIVAGSVVTVNVGFNKTVTGFDISDLTTTGGALSNFQVFDSENYTAILTLPDSGSGMVTVTLAADSVVPGNNLAADSISYFSPDAVAAVSISETSADAGDQVTVNITFDQSVNGLMASHITTNVGTLSNFQGSGSAYSVTLILPSSGMGTATVILAADSVNEGNNSAFDFVSYSTPPPVTPPSGGAVVYINPATLTLPAVGQTFSINVRASGVTGLTGFDIRLQYDDDIIEFVSASAQPNIGSLIIGSGSFPKSIQVGSNSISPALSGLVQLFTVDFRVLESRTNEIGFMGILPGDMELNAGSSSNLSFTVENCILTGTLPAIGTSQGAVSFSPATMILPAVGEDLTVEVMASGVVNLTEFKVPLQYDRDVLTFIQITGGPNIPSFGFTGNPVGGNDVGGIDPPISGDQSLFSIRFRVESRQNSEIVFVGDLARRLYFTDDSGDKVIPSIITGMMLTNDFPIPGADAVAAVSISETSVNAEDQVTVNITFDQSVNGLMASHITTNIGTLSNFQGSGSAYSVVLTLPSSGMGTANVILAADSVTEGNNSAFDSVSYSTPIPVIPPATVVLQSNQATFSNPSGPLIQGTDHVYFLSDITVTGLNSPLVINIDVGDFTFDADIVTSNEFSALYASEALSNRGSLPPGGNPIAALRLGQGVSIGDTTEIKVFTSTGPVTTHLEAGDPVVLSSPYFSFSPANSFLEIEGSVYVFRTTATVTSLPVGDNITFNFSIGGSQYGPVYITTADPGFSQYDEDVGAGLFIFEETLLPSNTGDSVLISVASGIEINSTGSMLVAVSNNAAEFYGLISPTTPPPVDTDAVATLSIAQTSAETGDQVPINITFDQTVTNFTLLDLATNGGTLSNFSGSGASYSAILNIPSTGSGTIIVRLLADSVDEGNNAASDSVSYVTPPVVPPSETDAIASVVIVPLTAETGAVVPVSITFDQTVTGLTASDLSADVGTLSGFTGSGSMYSVNVTVPSSGSGTIVVSLAADAVNEGNNAASDSFSYAESADSVASVVIVPLTAETGVVVPVSITFDQTVTGLTVSDLSVNGGVLSGFTGSGSMYSVNVTVPSSGSGTIVVSLAAGAVNEGNNAASDSFSYAEPADPVASIIIIPLVVETGSVVPVSIVFNQTVTGLTASDLSVDVGTLSGFAGSGSMYSVNVTVPSSGSGTIVVSLAADAVNEGNNAVIGSFDYAESVPEPEPEPEPVVFTSVYDAFIKETTHFQPRVIVEIGGVDVSHLLVEDHSVTTDSLLDTPTFNIYTTAVARFCLDNSDNQFNIKESPNFFTALGLPENGWQASVRISVLFENEGAPADARVIFVGYLEDITELSSPRWVSLLVLDKSGLLQHRVVEDFGRAVRANISGIDVGSDYTDVVPVFNLPENSTPVSRNSFSAGIHGGSIFQILPSLPLSGEYASYLYAGLDENTGQLLLGASPPEGEQTILSVGYKSAYRYRTPEALVFLLLEASGLLNDLTDDEKIFAKSLIESPDLEHTRAQWTSHGRPQVGDPIPETPVVRWITSDNGVFYLGGNRKLFQYERRDDASGVLDEYTLLSDCPDSDASIMQFAREGSDFYVLTVNSFTGAIAKLWKVEDGVTWTAIVGANATAAHFYDYDTQRDMVADNRKSFVIHSGWLYFVSGISIRRYELSSGTLETLYSQGTPTQYSWDFVIHSGNLYCFGTQRPAMMDTHFKIYRMGLDGSGVTELYSETFARSTTRIEPASVSDIVVRGSNFYFVLTFSRRENRVGFTELCRMNVSGASRRVLKRYENALFSGRSLVVQSEGTVDNIYFVEGTWVSRYFDVDDYPTKEDAGHLIKIDMADRLVDLGLAWQSFRSVDGRGQHTAFSSNLWSDSDTETFHCISGYGLPVDARDDSLLSLSVGEVASPGNWVWLQYGKKLSVKVPVFPTNDRTVWSLLEELARTVDFEVGFTSGQDEMVSFSEIYLGLTLEPKGYLFFRARLSRLSNVHIDESSLQHLESSLDTTLVFNYISVAFGGGAPWIAQDEMLVESDGVLWYPVDTRLLQNESVAWAELIGNRVLERQKEPRLKTRLPLKFSPHLELGQRVLLTSEYHSLDAAVYKLTQVEHDTNLWRTEIEAREDLDAVDGLVLPEVQDYEFNAGDSVSEVLAAASGGVIPYMYELLDAPSWVTFVAGTLTFSGTAVVGETFLRYRVTDDSGRVAEVSFRLIVSRVESLSFDGQTIPDFLHEVGCQIPQIRLPKVSGGVGMLDYSLMALPAGYVFDDRALTIDGIPEDVETIALMYTVTDSRSPTPSVVSLAFSFTIEARPQWVGMGIQKFSVLNEFGIIVEKITLYLLDNISKKIKLFDEMGVRQKIFDITLLNEIYLDADASEMFVAVLSSVLDTLTDGMVYRIRFYDLQGGLSNTISLPDGRWVACAITDSRIYALDADSTCISVFNSGGTDITSEKIILNITGKIVSMLVNGGILYLLLDNSSVILAYDLSTKVMSPLNYKHLIEGGSDWVGFDIDPRNNIIHAVRKTSRHSVAVALNNSDRLADADISFY